MVRIFLLNGLHCLWLDAMLIAGLVHLRDGDMMELVIPTIRQGGVNTVFVMVRNFNSYLSTCKKQHERLE